LDLGAFAFRSARFLAVWAFDCEGLGVVDGVDGVVDDEVIAFSFFG